MSISPPEPAKRAGSTELALSSLPQGATLHSVTAAAAQVDGRPCLRVELTPEARSGKPDVDFIDQPTFVLLPVEFRNGTISVDIRGRIRPDAPDYARGFAGIAYRVVGTGSAFESVYLRPANGLKVSPPSPRDQRAVQYFAFPDWKFDRLRAQAAGDYEAAANIAPDEWASVVLSVKDTMLNVTVNGVPVLALGETKATPVSGSVGLWVDIGTEAFFANLRIADR
jgi:hypothetical protein